MLVRARCWLLAGLLVLLVAPSAQASRLVQLPGAAGCILATAISDCTVQSGIGNPNGIAVKGNYVYVASTSDDAIHIYDRDPNTGALTPRPVDANGCISVQANACADARSLGDPFRMAFSPDGSKLYVTLAADHGVVALDVSSVNGSLSQAGFPQSCITKDGSANGLVNQCSVAPPLANPVGVTAYGSSVYVAGDGSSGGFVDVLDVISGGLSQHTPSAGGCAEQTVVTTGCLDARSINGGRIPTIPPDGKNVYVTGASSPSGVENFKRNADGSIALVAGPDGCLQATGAGQNCRETGLLGTEQYPIVFASDTRGWVGGVSGGHVTELARAPSTGGLTVPGPCVAVRTDGAFATCQQGAELFGLVDMAVSPNKDDLILGLRFGRGVQSIALDADGSMTASKTAENCLATGGINHSTLCTVPRGFARVTGQDLGPNGIALSPDGKFVYAASVQAQEDRAGILVAKRDTANPVCQDATIQVTAGEQAPLPLTCTDADGDALTLTILTQPAHGITGQPDQAGGKANYAAPSDFEGTETLTYKATANGHDSNTATITITIKKPPTIVTPPVVTSVPPVVQRIFSGLTNRWNAFVTYTQILALAAENVPAGTTVTITCKPKGKSKKAKKACPFTTKKVVAKSDGKRIQLRTFFKKVKYRLKPGTRVTITMTKPAFIGRYLSYLIRSHNTPKPTILCLAPGAKKPTKC